MILRIVYDIVRLTSKTSANVFICNKTLLCNYVITHTST